MNFAATEKALDKLIEQRPWIDSIDTDEPGSYIVTLSEPWCFYTDPGCGVRGFDSLGEVKKSTTEADVYRKVPLATFEKVEAHEVTPEVESLILKIANGIASVKMASAKKRGRKSMLTAAQEAVQAGQLPPPLEFASEANYTYNRHADRLHKLAVEGNLEALEATEIGGVNTYAKALRGYRDLLIQHLLKKAGAA
jgi:hypothetical protein